MSDKESDDSKDKSKRSLEVSSEGNDEEEKRSTRKRARVDYNEDKKPEAKPKDAVAKDEGMIITKSSSFNFQIFHMEENLIFTLGSLRTFSTYFVCDFKVIH